MLDYLGLETNWICQQIRDIKSLEKVIYFSPGTGNFIIDETRIATEFPGTQVFGDGQKIEFLHQIPQAKEVYIELGYYMELEAISQVLDYLIYRAIAVLPQNSKNSEYHAWADEIIYGSPVPTLTLKQLWRILTTGQVIDENSSEEYWYEITHNAYGIVTRANGIFEVNDGCCLYCDFVDGVA